MGPVTPQRPVSDALAVRARRRGSSPLLTHYGVLPGERTELSVTSFANWVDKTANLLDDLGLDADADVILTVLAERPAHWMGLVWPFALWQRGIAARVAPREEVGLADLAVTGPDAPAPLAAETLACSLHPWGLPLVGLPAGVTDYSSAALAQPDAHVPGVPDADALAWVDAERRLDAAALAGVSGVAGRVLARPTTAWDAVALLVGAVLGGGSVVLVEGADEATADDLAAREHAARVS